MKKMMIAAAYMTVMCLLCGCSNSSTDEKAVTESTTTTTTSEISEEVTEKESSVITTTTEQASEIDTSVKTEEATMQVGNEVALDSGDTVTLVMNSVEFQERNEKGVVMCDWGIRRKVPKNLSDVPTSTYDICIASNSEDIVVGELKAEDGNSIFNLFESFQKERLEKGENGIKPQPYIVTSQYNIYDSEGNIINENSSLYDEELLYEYDVLSESDYNALKKLIEDMRESIIVTEKTEEAYQIADKPVDE